MNLAESTTLEPRPKVSLLTIFTSYFVVGLTAFVARQQAAETLSQEARTAFYGLRRQVQTQPSLVARDEALALIKPVLADVASEISAALAVDYTALTR